MNTPLHTRLFVLGAGPVGTHLAHLAKSIDFDVTVIDERAELLLPERFPLGSRLIAANFDAYLPTLITTPRDFVAIVTQVWQHDARALELLAGRDLAYLGMIGCRRKLDDIFPQLEAAGVPCEALARVHAPIGINIGSKTPAEIAVSIAAELVATRRAKSEPA